MTKQILSLINIDRVANSQYFDSYNILQVIVCDFGKVFSLFIKHPSYILLLNKLNLFLNKIMCYIDNEGWVSQIILHLLFIF